MVAHAGENAIGLLLIVVDALTNAPAMRRKERRHRVILFAIRGRTGRPWTSVGVRRPPEVAYVRVLRVGYQHVGIGAVPEPVERMLLVHLNGDHQPEAAPFAAVRPGRTSQRRPNGLLSVESDPLGATRLPIGRDRIRAQPNQRRVSSTNYGAPWNGVQEVLGFISRQPLADTCAGPLGSLHSTDFYCQFRYQHAALRSFISYMLSLARALLSNKATKAREWV